MKKEKIKLVRKLIEDKKLIRKCIEDGGDLSELAKERNIKFANPLKKMGKNDFFFKIYTKY